MRSTCRWWAVFCGIVTAMVAVVPGMALAYVPSLNAPGAPEEVTDRLRAASAVMATESHGRDSPQEVLAAAMSDYRTLVQVLYAEGYFSPVVTIRLDGREAADFGPLHIPHAVNRVEISVTTGPAYRFGRADIGPLAPETDLPEGYATGQPASTGVIRDAAIAGVDGWRDVGHAKAEVGGQKITANHPAAKLDADLRLLPGPKLSFGTMILAGETTVRPEAIAKIAGFPAGETYSPAQVQKVTTRLRRTGTFASVSITEAETPNGDATLDFETTLRDMPQRQLSFGAELSSSEGLDLSFKWTHRNFFGAAERLRFEAKLRNLGGQEDVDGRIALRLDRPATLGPDDNTFYIAEIERKNQEHYNATRALVGIGARRVFSDNLLAEMTLTGGVTIADDAFGTDRRFELITLPTNIVWDKRNDKVNATKGFFLDATLTPFVGFGGTQAGAQIIMDGRGYFSLTQSNSIVLAGRIQMGSVVGASQAGTSPEFLFFTGGAGSVRGQPFESLGIPVGASVAGGRSMLAASAEIRGKVTEKISLVGFFDIAAVDAGSFVSDASSYHSGAGLGIRYDLGGFGPLRFDLAYPVSGSTGDGLQFYLGIGQAF